MTTETITEQGHRHGAEYADHHWQIWPAHHTEAIEWCAAADAGTVHEYGLPDDAADAIPCDLDTDGWSWGELADYQGAWETAFYARMTELCRNVIEKVSA